MQRFMIVAASTILVTAGVALAGTTAGPSTTKATGQPNQSCEDSGVGVATNRPGNAFYAPGSAFNDVSGKAGTVYAGNGQTTNTPASPNAVSQYDVACANQAAKVP